MEFDTYLFLFDSSFNTLIALDDDSGGGTNSLIAQDVAAGDYIIVANTVLEGEVGNYRLDIGFIPEPKGWMMTTSGATLLGLLHRRRVRRLQIG